MEGVRRGPDGQGGAEVLVSALILILVELGQPERPLESREEVRDCLRVVPDVRAGTVAAPYAVAAAFPGPHPAVSLAQHGRRLEDGQVCGDGLDHFRRQRHVVEAVSEPAGPLPKRGVVLLPVRVHGIHVRERSCIPGNVVVRLLRGTAARRPAAAGLVFVRIFAGAQVTRGNVPGQPHGDRLLLSRIQTERHVDAAAGARAALGNRPGLDDRRLGDRLPYDAQGVEPATTEPAAVGPRLWAIDDGAERSLVPRTSLRARLGEHEAARRRKDRVAARARRHEVARVEGENPLQRFSCGIAEMVLQTGDRQARVVLVARREWAPSLDRRLQRDPRVAQLDGCEGEASLEFRAAEARQPVALPFAPVPRAGVQAVPRMEDFPLGHRPLQNPCDVLFALHTDCREDQRFVENVRPVADGDVRERSRALEADHSGPYAAERERGAVQMITGVGAVVGVPTRCHRYDLPCRGGAQRPPEGITPAAEPSRQAHQMR